MNVRLVRLQVQLFLPRLLLARTRGGRKAGEWMFEGLDLTTILVFVAIGFTAQAIDGALGMAFGQISSTLLISIGVPPAAASAGVHTAETFTTAGATKPHRLTGDIVAQISGTGTAINAVLERNPQDPALHPNGWALADPDAYVGSVAAGMAARRYHDPLAAFYRFRVITLTGSATVAISGESA